MRLVIRGALSVQVNEKIGLHPPGNAAEPVAEASTSRSDEVDKLPAERTIRHGGQGERRHNRDIGQAWCVGADTCLTAGL